MSDKLKKETFTPLLNTKFKITFDDEYSYEVELIELKEGNSIPSLNLEPFTLTFRGDPKEKSFAQGSFKLQSEAIGSLELFLVPRFPDKDGIYYDAMIS